MVRFARSNSGIKFRPDANTVLWLPGQDDSPSSTIRDRSGNGNNGTITGATWARTGKGLWYLNFDGADDLVNCGTGTTLETFTAVTILAWVNPGSEGETQGRIFDKAGAKRLFINAATMEIGGLVVGTGNATSVTVEQLATDTWQLVGMTFSFAGDKKVYITINGVAATYSQQDALTGTIADTSANNFTIGNYSESTIRTWDGGIALFRKINNVLTSAQELAFFQRERHLFGV